MEKLRQDFRGSEKITLELRAPVANAMTDIYPKFKVIQQVETVEYGGQEGDVHKFSIHAVKGSDIREQLFRQIVTEGWILLEMSRKATSLEEVFHKLTTAENN